MWRFCLLALVVVFRQTERGRRGGRVVAQLTAPCLTGNRALFPDGTEANADCRPGDPWEGVFDRAITTEQDEALSHRQDDDVFARCEGNAFLPILDHPDLGNFGQCVYEDNVRERLKRQQTDALTTDEETAGNVTASAENQSQLCGAPSGVNRTDITDLGTAALGSCPSEKPLCARTSDSRFCYCINLEDGLFTGLIVADFLTGVTGGQSSSLCFPPALDPCFNSVNRFAVPLDCAASLPVVERMEDIGPDPREQSVKPNGPPPVPQQSTFAQLVPGTYLFQDVHSDAYLDTISNTGTNVSSCMRIQGKPDDDSGLDGFFLDLSCNTAEGVSVTLQFDCPDTGLCSQREGNPAVATIQGVLRVENASNLACRGVDAQIEMTLTGFVDEAESLIAQQFEYDQLQRILIIGNETQDDLVTARALGLISQARDFSLGLLTFPDDVPESCDILLNQRVFTVTSSQEAGSILALATSGYGRNTTSGDIIRKNPLEVSQFAFDNREAFQKCSEVCGDAAPSSGILGIDFSLALLGEVLPTIFFPIYQPEQSPDLSFSSFFIGDSFFTNTTLDTTECSGDDRFNRSGREVSALCTEALDLERPRSFELFSAETGVSLDLILKGQLGNLIDGREVLANCRGLRLQNLPVDFDPGDDALYAQPLVEPSSFGEVVSVALALNEGVLGADTCVFISTDGTHTCKGITRGSEHRINASVEIFSTVDDPTIKSCTERFSDFATGDGDVLPNRCVIAFERFEACPEIVLNASSTAQPSSYRMTDLDTGWCIRIRPEDSTEEVFLFSCEGEDADLQVRINYDVEALDGRIALRSLGQPQVGFANVGFKGTVRQVWPPECEGILMFVEGTQAGGLSFEPQGEELTYPGETSYLPTIREFAKSIAPELIFTSSASFANMDYTILSAPDNISAERCLLPTVKLTYRKFGTGVIEFDNGTIAEVPIFSFPSLSVDNSGPEDNPTFVDSYIQMYGYGPGRQGRGIDFLSRVSGHLREVCDIPKEGVQIQCLARRPFVLLADEDFLKPDDDFNLTSVARVQTQYGIDPDDLPLQSPDGFTLSCSRDDVERVQPAGFIVRTIPFFVEAPSGYGKTLAVQQLCPVLTFCTTKAEKTSPASNGQTQDGKRPL
ncbi:unnamed protein product [Vitrella brassicaformis CCMP3155]|uniref:Thyroglobulin type-1 domain-containing protein n=1 Tax=Vitrella brassicaformis (strain CCMP3155) TaxID=1169540 RepID=A0A0G4GR65_VITBC|nr:unnamed protein product [Vitrella brassicaformis CCMP3155]|eukprot:CEM32985.1 unnamed protein product [Vitrella brassicaformis CCMP3155]